MKRIYLDYAATTPLDPAVLKKMLPYFSHDFANPASVHSVGQSALKAVDDARYAIADLLGAKGNEIIFSSGATESNNLAIKGLSSALKDKGDRRKEILVSPIEHDSVREPLHILKKAGYTINYLPVDANGLISVKSLQQLLNKNVFLVSIGLVNSETGTIQNISKLGRAIRKYNEQQYQSWLNSSPRSRGPKPGSVYFHCDATQAPNVLDCNVRNLNIDLMSLSAHKIYGPKGSGLLYCKHDTPLEALLHGGHQERNLRSGSLNVPSIIGFAEALKFAVKNRKKVLQHLSALQKQFVRDLKKLIPQARITVSLDIVSPCHLNVIFPGLSGDAFQAALDERGIAVSTGSACASGDITASHVLRALGFSEKEAQSAIRFSFGKLCTKNELKNVARLVSKTYYDTLKAYESRIF